MAKAFRDYNILSNMGTTDLELLREHRGPEKYAGTNMVNTWMINNEYKENLAAGTSVEEANALKNKAQRTVAEVRRMRGY